MRERPPLPVLVLALTAPAMPDDKERCLGVWADACLELPGDAGPAVAGIGSPRSPGSG
ncbi:MAG: hypothetical protein H7834_16825 [Magnetococcus sp. YQC-9]